MASQLQIFACATCVLGLLGLATSDGEEFPKFNELVVLSYTTEVQVTDTNQQDSAYATEYYDSQTGGTGKLEIIVEQQIVEIYYKNETYETLEVNGTNCQVWGIDESPYTTTAAFYGWYNENPLVIGPAAPLFYAQSRRNDIKFAGKEEVRNIPCDKYTLDILGERETVTLEYYFAPKDWITPYQMKDLRTPVRIRAVGNSSKESESADEIEPVDIITDFAYFRPYLDYDLDLEPPVGIGCYSRATSDNFPQIPKTFQYSAEVIDLLYEEEHIDVDVKLERVWYDGENKIGRFDIFKKTTSSSSFQDFNTGVMFEFTKERKCAASPLKNAFFEKYDVDMIGKMKDEREVLNLDGDFYAMGQRNIRGVTCNTYETVKKDVYFKEQLERLVVTAYFSENYLKVGIDGEDEIGIPIVILLTGWRKSNEMAFKLQYNIFTFKDVIWPTMYSDFGIDMCYTRAESKAYFVLIIDAATSDAAKMEAQDELVSQELRGLIVKYAEIPEWRLPFLKVDYKTTGVYATGMMIERPPALLQFTEFDSGDEKTYKNDIAIIPEAYTLEQCAAGCIDFNKDPCKGFYFCNTIFCYAKVTDPTEEHDPNEEVLILPDCAEYIRAERDSTNFGNTPLKTGLEKLEKAILNRSLEVVFEIPNGDEAIKVTDIVIGEGPYTGAEGADKAYKVNIQYRQLDPSLSTSTVAKGAEMLNDCYKKCKAAGSECAAFSFCGRSKSQSKGCILSSDMIIRGKTDDSDLIPTMDCDIYDLKYLEHFTKYPEHASFISGYQVNTKVETLEECAKQCRLEENGKCRGFEYCSHMKTCSLHTKHILDLGPGGKGTPKISNPCVHYSARFIADYVNMGNVYLKDDSNVRYDTSLEECARICSEELGASCLSFNYCPSNRGSCAFSRKVIGDPSTDTVDKKDCKHFEKRDGVNDWNNSKAKELSKSGWTSKGFTGLVIGMLALGLILGALGFVGYSYVRSRQQGEGLTVRFMKQET